MKLHLGDCNEVMNTFKDNSIDMVLTSPPYDNLRNYGENFKGFSPEIWKPCLKHIYRILKQGGVCVWVVNDETVNGSESGTSFRQALFAKDKCGFNLHDTMIYHKNNPMPNESIRYQPCLSICLFLVKTNQLSLTL